MPSRRPKSPPRWPSLVLVVTVTLIAACGSGRRTGDSKDEEGRITECDAFVASYERCLRSLGPPSVAAARAEQTRTSLAEQATHGAPAREALRRTCADNLARLAISCR